MIKRVAAMGVGVLAMALAACPAMAKHHQGEAPETVHHHKGKSVKTASAPAAPAAKASAKKTADSPKDKTEVKGKDGVGHK